MFWYLAGEWVGVISEGGGEAPHFKMRIEAAEQGMSVANWFKNLAREALKTKGIEPKV